MKEEKKFHEADQMASYTHSRPIKSVRINAEMCHERPYVSEVQR